MIRVAQHACITDINLGKNATFLAGKKYWSKQTKNGTGMLILSEEKRWVKVASTKMTTGLQPIVYFTFVDCLFVNNKKELNLLTKTHPQEQEDFEYGWMEALGL
ncbi:hypothetical protein [Bacillus cereus]|uniref:hypothetical protein n=1 Tax=Bacillus cereus TaxID=1396 RepID=UPI000BF8BA4E|nr:hypothetical protein [Bacillus cereus]PFA76833.1 hypothetical protein CN406_17415 [Bacillus cereus]